MHQRARRQRPRRQNRTARIKSELTQYGNSDSGPYPSLRHLCRMHQRKRRAFTTIAAKTIAPQAPHRIPLRIQSPRTVRECCVPEKHQSPRRRRQPAAKTTAKDQLLKERCRNQVTPKTINSHRPSPSRTKHLVDRRMFRKRQQPVARHRDHVAQHRRPSPAGSAAGTQSPMPVNAQRNTLCTHAMRKKGTAPRQRNSIQAKTAVWPSASRISFCACAKLLRAAPSQ